MIIYNDLEYESTFKAFTKRIDDIILALKDISSADHDSIRGLFINFGEFHTAAADSLFEKEEYNHPIISRFSQAEIYLAKVLLSSWYKKKKDIEQEYDLFLKLYQKISENCISGVLKGKAAEGFAFYAYYPEAFFISAEKFYQDHKPEDVYCIGIRSIGTSLSAAVAAMLEKKGCLTHLVTFRTRGDFENRYLSVNKTLMDKLTTTKNSYYLIIDEGPGLSGSTFGVTASFLTEAGIPDDRIILFCTRNPEAKDLKHDEGKAAWDKHTKYVTSFEELWLDSGKLKEVFKYDELKDLSSGKWIKEYNVPDNIPADPVEERKKFLIMEDNNRFIIKYIGFGANGRKIFQRMKLLSQNGFIPDIKSVKEGFIQYKFIDGRLLTSKYRDKEFFNFASQYFLFIHENLPSEEDLNKEAVFNMILENCSELLGQNFKYKVEASKDLFLNSFLDEAVYIDGNVLPHEWIKTNTGYCKLDSGEHASDHMFPGCQSILWDLAAYIIEFNLDEDEKNGFMQNFIALNDRFQSSFPFYAIAYSAFRMAFCSVKADIYKNQPLGKIFEEFKNKYIKVLNYYIKLI